MKAEGSGKGGSFDEQLLAEKLSKLNNSQQSIESVSHWCIPHRKNSKHIVETWQKQFDIASKEQKVSLLYLANDIIQNSKRKGTEFVSEFWKVLPSTLKHVYDNGTENEKKVVTRLISIWDERRVFGSRGQGLKDCVLNDAPLSQENDEKILPPANNSSNPSKVVRKDSRTVRIKLSVGGMPERIVTAYQSVLNEHFDEDTALNKCKTSVSLLDNLEMEVNEACTSGNPIGSSVSAEIHEQEGVLKQCIQQLEHTEATRAGLIGHLKEALKEQESKFELVHSQLQVARNRAEHAVRIQQQLTHGGVPLNNGTSFSVGAVLPELAPVGEHGSAPSSSISQSSQISTSLAGVTSSAGDEYKKTAAAVAAKLAASSSSAQVLTSILSSLVAEEAALKSGVSSGLNSTSSPDIHIDKRPKIEKPVAPVVSDNNTLTFFSQVQQQQQQQMRLPGVSFPSIPPLSQNGLGTSVFQPPPPLPPMPPPLLQQFGQSAGGIPGVPPFGLLGGGLPPPPPFSPLLPAGITRPSAPLPPPPTVPPLPQQQLQPMQQQQQPQRPLVSSGFFTTTGMSFFGPVSATPSVQRQ